MRLKHHKLMVVASVVSAVGLVLAGCSSSGTGSSDAAPSNSASSEAGSDSGSNAVESSGSLVVYSPNDQTMLDKIVPAFEKESGIKVQLVTAGTGELYQRIESEAGNPGGDVLFGGSAAQAIQNPDLWEPYTSVNDDKMVDPEGRNPDGKVTPYIADGSNLLVNTDLIGDIKVDGYEDLLNPALKGKISFGDPSQSSSAFAQLTNMLKAMGGDYTSQKGWDYVAALIKNTDGIQISSSSQVAKGVADGEYDVALTYEDPSAQFVEAGSPVKIVYPVEGTVYLPATSQIIKGAKNLENAKKFIDFTTSSTAQDIFGTQLTNRPLRSDAKLGPAMTPLANIKTIQEDTSYVATHKDDIVKHYQQLWASGGK